MEWRIDVVQGEGVLPLQGDARITMTRDRKWPPLSVFSAKGKKKTDGILLRDTHTHTLVPTESIFTHTSLMR